MLLASEARPFGPRTIEFAAALAGRSRAPVHVFSVARIWGTSLGFPNPGLYPSRTEWDEQRRIVEKAVKALRRGGVSAHGRVVGTRRAAKRILGEGLRLRCDAIVMGADPPRHALIADFIWSQEPYRVRRRATVPVYLIEE